MSTSKYCVYCGNPLKSSDKFCIICGKPVLRDLPKGRKEEKKKPVEKQRGKIKEESKEIIIEDEVDEVLPTKKKLKKAKAKDEIVETPLPFEVKEQMILYIEYNDIQLNKQLLSDKLKELQKALKDPQYEFDEEYKKGINIKLTAIKTLIDELKQNEAELDQKMDKPFIVQRIQNDIDTKIFQLKNLTKEFRLKKVDKDSFEQLREKYKQEKSDLETERMNLIAGMKLWIKELKMEKTELRGERNLNKGRYSAKEISEEDFKKKNKEFETKLKKIDVKINTLQNLTK